MQHLIAEEVAIGVVVSLKPVDIQCEDPEWSFLCDQFLNHIESCCSIQ